MNGKLSPTAQRFASHLRQKLLAYEARFGVVPAWALHELPAEHLVILVSQCLRIGLGLSARDLLAEEGR
jgi:hypothetical protein